LLRVALDFASIAAHYLPIMKTLTVRLPESLFDEIEQDARARKVSKSEIVRQRLEQARDAKRPLVDEMDDLEAFQLIAQLLGLSRPLEAAA
jgi:Arc/MetJ-type ribon-helix-helix transcriptional regulator